MLNFQIAEFKKVSKVYRKRLVAAGFITLKDVIDAWLDEDKLYDAVGGNLMSLNRFKREIETEVESHGYEIIPRYEICGHDLRVRREQERG